MAGSGYLIGTLFVVALISAAVMEGARIGLRVVEVAARHARRAQPHEAVIDGDRQDEEQGDWKPVIIGEEDGDEPA